MSKHPEGRRKNIRRVIASLKGVLSGNMHLPGGVNAHPSVGRVLYIRGPRQLGIVTNNKGHIRRRKTGRHLQFARP